MLVLFLVMGVFFSGVHYERNTQDGANLLDNNVGKYVCAKQLKVFKGYENNIPICK